MVQIDPILLRFSSTLIESAACSANTSNSTFGELRDSTLLLVHQPQSRNTLSRPRFHFSLRNGAMQRHSLPPNPVLSLFTLHVSQTSNAQNTSKCLPSFLFNTLYIIFWTGSWLSGKCAFNGPNMYCFRFLCQRTVTLCSSIFMTQFECPQHTCNSPRARRLAGAKCHYSKNKSAWIKAFVKDWTVR